MKKPRELSTTARIEQFQGKEAILKTWEQMNDSTQISEHDYIKDLKKRVRQVKMYILHRADREAVV